MKSTSRINFSAPPPDEPLLSDCSFYHTIDIPGIGLCMGQWDLRPGIKDYLGSLSFSGKNVLEIGTANGFVCFEMERRGASVTTVDLNDDLTYDSPPLSEEYLNAAEYKAGLHRIRNGFWLAYKRLRSNAKVYYGHVNRLPETLHGFDVGVIANVLQHLQDPIGALIQVATRSSTIVVTEADWMHGMYEEAKALIYFDKNNPYVWYQVKPVLVEAVLKRMGFTVIEKLTHTQKYLAEAEHQPDGTIKRTDLATMDVPHFTIVAVRS